MIIWSALKYVNFRKIMADRDDKRPQDRCVEHVSIS